MKNVSKRANGDGSIYFEKSRNRWACAIVDPSGKRIVRRFKTEQEAKDYLTITKSSIITNIYIQPQDITFGQWLVDYLKLYVVPNAARSTLRTYTNQCTYAEPLKNIPIQKLTTNNLQKLINDLPSRLKNSTKRGIATLLRRSLKKAYQTRLIPYNPMDGVKIPKAETSEIETFTIEEMKTILTYLSQSQSTKRNYVIYSILFASGMRLGEILALQVTDVYDDRVNINKSVTLDDNHKTIIGPTKNKKSRNITLPASIIALLRSMPPNKDGFIFYSRYRKQLLNESNMQDMWRNILKKVDLPYRKIHAIRHTHATQLLENGVSVTEVSKRLGHSSIMITLNTYSHVLRDKEHKDYIANKVGEIFKM